MTWKCGEGMQYCRGVSSSITGALGLSRKEAEVKRRPPTLRAIVAVLAAAGTLLARSILWIMQPVLVLALRAAVRSRAFWERGIGSAWSAPPPLSCPYHAPALLARWRCPARGARMDCLYCS